MDITRAGDTEGEDNFKDGRENGRFRTYDERENVTDEDIYEDGECVEVCEGNA